MAAISRTLSGPDEHDDWVQLIERLYQQLRYGCTNSRCRTPTCRTCQARVSEESPERPPYRRPAPGTARAMAVTMAENRDAASKLCPNTLRPVDADDGAFSSGPDNDLHDPSSLVQQFFHSDAWHRADMRQGGRSMKEVNTLDSVCSALLEKPTPFDKLVTRFNILFFSHIWDRGNTTCVDALFTHMNTLLSQTFSSKQDLANTLVATSALLVAAMEPFPDSDDEMESKQWTNFSQSVGDNLDFIDSSSVAFKNSRGDARSKLHRYLHLCLSIPAKACMAKMMRILYEADAYKPYHNLLYCSRLLDTEQEHLGRRHRYMLMEVLLVWAKLLFREVWTSKSILDEDSDAVCALKFMDQFLYRRGAEVVQFSRQDAGRMPLVGRRIEIPKDPASWMSRQKSAEGEHILQYKWLFSQRERFIFFRSLNYQVMFKSFESSMETNALEVRMYNTVKEAASSSSRRQEVYERLKTLITQFLVLEIRRDNILEDALNQLWRRAMQELRRPLKIKMGMDMGEEGVDLGGVQQEFFRLAMAEALRPELALFREDPITKMIWFSAMSPAPLYQFALLGMLFGLALFNGITLPVTFPLYFYKSLLGEGKPSLDDIKDGWPEIHKGLRSILDYESDDVEDVFALTYAFPVELPGRTAQIDIDYPFPTKEADDDTAAVTNSNRADYAQKYARTLLYGAVKPQVDAFHQGFRTIISAKSLQLFSSEDLQRVVEGEGYIDVAALRGVAKYIDGYTAESVTVKNFWEIVEAYDQEQLRRLLEFVTASERVPAAGMQDLSFVIQRNGSDGERLPTSMTCFGRLLLPDYESRAVLEQRLRVALENCEGFGVA